MDTTDLYASLVAVHERLSMDASRFCTNAIILVSDGSLHPFSSVSGRVPAPAAALDSAAALFRRIDRSDGFLLYPLIIGSAPAIHPDFNISWTQQEGAKLPSDLTDLNARTFLEGIFGEVYDLDSNSLQRMLLTNDGALFPSALSLTYDPNGILSAWANRRTNYVIVEEPPHIRNSWCESPAPAGVVATRSPRGSCLLHTETVSDALRRHVQNAATLLMTRPDELRHALPDSLDDVHWFVFNPWKPRESQVTCTPTRISKAFFDGSLSESRPSNYDMRIKYVNGSRDASGWFDVKLVQLRNSSCLALHPLGDGHSTVEASELEVEIHVRDGSAPTTILQDKVPLRQPLVRAWQFHRTRTLVSSLFLIDRWYVEGSVVVGQTAVPSAALMHFYGHNFSLHRNPTCSASGLSYRDGLDSCYTLSEIYIGPQVPDLALLAFTADCGSSPRNCHFANLSSRVRFLLPISAALLLLITGMLVNAAWKWKELAKSDGIESLLTWRVAASIIGSGLAFVWIGEVFIWASPLRSGRALSEFVLPAALALIAARPMTLIDAVRTLLRLLHGERS